MSEQQTEVDVWQNLMNAAYDRWQEGDLKGMKPSKFIDSLDERSKEAVLLGNLNYQYGNGGFEQWVGNGYGVYVVEILDLLEKIDGPAVRQMRNCLEDLEPLINTEVEDRGCCGNYWKPLYFKVGSGGRYGDQYEEADGAADEYGAMIAKENTRHFREFYKQFTEEVGKYFSNQGVSDGAASQVSGDVPEGS